MMKYAILSLALLFNASIVMAAPVSGLGTWERTLHGRDLDNNLDNGFEAYYDSVLNITWLAHTSGSQGTWYESAQWASELNVSGYTGWRLPAYKGADYPRYDNLGSNAGFRVNPYTSELAHLFYITLGNKGYPDGYPQIWGIQNTGVFDTLKPLTPDNMQIYYWLGQENAYRKSEAWIFSFTSGQQGVDRKAIVSSTVATWVVMDGDIANRIPVTVPVPEPSTYAMLGLGLGVMGFAARRRKSA